MRSSHAILSTCIRSSGMCAVQGSKGSMHDELYCSMPSSATAGPRSLLIETLTTAAGLFSLQMLFLLNCLAGTTSGLLVLVSPVFVHARCCGP